MSYMVRVQQRGRWVELSTRGVVIATVRLHLTEAAILVAELQEEIEKARRARAGMGYDPAPAAPKGDHAIPAPITADPSTWPDNRVLAERAADSESPLPEAVSRSPVCTCRWCCPEGYAAGYVPPAAQPDPAPPSGTRAGGVAAAGGATTTDASGHPKILP